MNHETEAAIDALHTLVMQCMGRIATLEVALTGRETGGAFPFDTDERKQSAIAFVHDLENRANETLTALHARINQERGIHE